jgi:hypothetical protein
MRARLVIGVSSLALLGSVAAFGPAAFASAHPKVPPVCVQKSVTKNLHVQVGYCPGR